MSRRPSRRIRRPGSGQAGYSLVEMMISMLIMVTVTGAIFSLVNPAQGTFRAQPEVADMQQRMRVGIDVLQKELLMAGAGTYQGATIGSLANFFSPVLPRRIGSTNPDNYNVAADNRITITYVPNTYSQTTVKGPQPMPPNSTELKVEDQANCPKHNQLCGFETGMQVLLFDNAGNFDFVTITKIQDDAGHLQHQGQGLSVGYEPGSSVTEVRTHTFWLDTSKNQLMEYDGFSTDTPLVDNVVGLTFEYFGDATPPTAPKATGKANCLYDAAGNLTYNPAPLATGDGSLAPLPLDMFKDGPWCSDPGNITKNSYDADLLRVRKIRVTLRVQASSASMRGTNPSGMTLFVNPGIASRPEEYLPDHEIRFEVSPRNLNLGR